MASSASSSASTHSATPVRQLKAGFLGRVPYPIATGLQERIRAQLAAGEGPEHLLLLEHPHVYTLGRNADRGGLLASADWLERRGVTVHDSDRGGQVTYHGPGQLVGYPILNLDPDRRDIRRYVCDLQRVLIQTLRDLHIEAAPGLPDRLAGVWVEDRKIASIGVHIRRWITTHGFALNVSPDLSLFSGIVPCGVAGIELTSVASLTGAAPSLSAVADLVAGHFCALFGRSYSPMDPLPEPPSDPGDSIEEPVAADRP